MSGKTDSICDKMKKRGNFGCVLYEFLQDRELIFSSLLDILERNLYNILAGYQNFQVDSK